MDALTDWSITAQPPLTLRNDLPVAAHYVLWERPARGGSLVLRQQGRLEGWSSINVYSVDMRQQVGGGPAPLSSCRSHLWWQASAVAGLHQPDLFTVSQWRLSTWCLRVCCVVTCRCA